MVDGPRVKGVAFRSVYGSLGTLRGEPAQQAALAVLSEELRNGFVYGAIVPGGWYPIAWYKELFRGIRSSTLTVSLSRSPGTSTVNLAASPGATVAGVTWMCA